MALDLKQAEGEIRTIMREEFPHTALVSVEVAPWSNFEGEPSLLVTIVMGERPKPSEMKRWSKVVRKFREWLASFAEDERFPYINFTTAADQQEIADAH